jgi:hypothetical protein
MASSTVKEVKEKKSRGAAFVRMYVLVLMHKRSKKMQQLGVSFFTSAKFFYKDMERN